MWRLLLRSLVKLGGAGTDRTRESEPTRDEEFADVIVREQLGFDRIDEQPYTHPTVAFNDVKQLKRETRHGKAEELLLWCIDFVEAEAAYKGYSEPPAKYYRHLAIVYRKDHRYETEVNLLKRYVRVCNELGGEPTPLLGQRLERACELANNRSQE